VEGSPTWWARAVASLQALGPIAALLAVAAGLRCYRLGDWPGQLIGDEGWYVQDARVILGLPLPDLKGLPAHPMSGIDPNAEHPPLAKLIMAGSMKLFGNTDIAWRIPSVVLSTLGILLLYLIVQRLGGNRRLALFAAFVLAFDNLSFVQGRIAMLEVYLITFILLGTWLYLSELPELAGIAFALATLCKINGLLGLGAVLLYEAALGFRRAWRGSLEATLTWPALRPSWARLRPGALATVFCVIFLLAGLGAVDNYWTGFEGPLDHLVHMVSYHSTLTYQGAPTGAASLPPQWWLNQGTMDYFVRPLEAEGEKIHIVFRAAMNEYVIWAAPLALFFAGQRAWVDRSKLATFAVASFVANFGPPFLAWAILSRTSYIYYMGTSIPAFACAIAVAASAVPRSVIWCYVGAMLYSFACGFPFRYLGF
jgi:predicted membrane-bound dolichyl-phosphate-mannose-protein mannosyltransferase